MPRFGLEASRLVRSHDVLSLHLPQFDAAGLAVRGRLTKHPTVLTYHCDLLLPAGIVNRACEPDRRIGQSNRGLVRGPHRRVHP